MMVVCLCVWYLQIYLILFNRSVQSFPCEVKMEVDSNCDADDDMMSTSTPSSVDDLFGDFDIDTCLMNDGLPL